MPTEIKPDEIMDAVPEIVGVEVDEVETFFADPENERLLQKALIQAAVNVFNGEAVTDTSRQMGWAPQFSKKAAIQVARAIWDLNAALVSVSKNQSYSRIVKAFQRLSIAENELLEGGAEQEELREIGE